MTAIGSIPLAVQTYYDGQYNARDSVHEAGRLIGRYTEHSAPVLAWPQRVADVPYGDSPTELLDIYPADTPDAPVFIFIHGGYWRALGKQDSACVVPALHAAGVTVVVIDYDLMPQASLDHIVDQVRKATAWVFHHIAGYGADPQRIHVSGSSAGGHLAGMLVTGQWHADYRVPQDVVKGAVLLSGLFDLQPLTVLLPNTWMQMDEACAMRNSPRFLLPPPGAAQACPILVCCGEYESREFKRQSTDFLQAWNARCLPGAWVETPGTNHFDLVLTLADPASPLFVATLQLLQPQPAA
ncbi:alpha/beta hydrolase [Rhodoferax sp.]|uniref:alpha/beta hydrolase n=1 Tax=Rhodoferax sp. TaxID=50421 RepID=UPI00374DD32B